SIFSLCYLFRNPFSSTTIRDANPIRTLGEYSNPSHEGYRNTIELHVGNNVVPLRSDTIRLVQNGCTFHGLRSEDPNQHLKDILKLVDSFDLDGENRERTRVRLFQFSLRDQASNWLERLLAGSISIWEDLTTRFLAQFFLLGRTAKLRNDILMFQQHQRESLSEAWTRFKDLLQKFPYHDIDLWLQDEPLTNRLEPEARGLEVEYFDTFLTRSELAYYKYLMCGPIPSIFLGNPIIAEGCPSNLKISCNIGHVHVEKAYIDLNSPLNVMTRMIYNWFMRRKLDPRENSNEGISNFTGRIKGMHVFIGNFTYVTDFMIVEDISSIIDPRLSTDEIAYKMPHKIEQYNSLSDLEKEHTKSVYLRNKEEKRKGVEYVVSKILGFYKECIELGPEYVTGMDDEGKITFLALGWLLEEIHVTWAYLEKKLKRLQTYTKSHEDICKQWLETASETRVSAGVILYIMLAGVPPFYSETVEETFERRDELIGNLKVYEVVLEKDSNISKVKKEIYKSLALKAKKVSSDEEISYSESDDEEYAMVVRDFKKFFKRRGKFICQPHDDKKNFRRIKKDKKEKEDRRSFKCRDLNHFISDCPKHSYNDQKAFVVGCWSDSEDDSKKDEICLIALDNNEVLSDTPYYSSSSLDSESLQNEYNKKRVEQLERNKEACLKCESCDDLQSKVSSLSLKLASFESSSIFLQEMLEKQKTQKDKHEIGFTRDIASTSNTKTKKSGPVDK
ncbi:retrotransposon ORF1, partial [Tanacetum coccineum]